MNQLLELVDLLQLSASGLPAGVCFGFSCGVLLPLLLPLVVSAGGVAGLQRSRTWFSSLVIDHSIKPGHRSTTSPDDAAGVPVVS